MSVSSALHSVLRVDLVPILTGFLTGAAIFLCHRVLDSRVTQKRLDFEDDGPADDEPAPEPSPEGPEPVPAASEEGPPKTWIPKMASALTLAVLGWCLLVALRGASQQRAAPLPPPKTFELVAKARVTEEPLSANMVTLNLTRQEMAVQDADRGVTHYKSAYWSSLSVGSPPQHFRVVFDTGSGHLLLPSAFCHSSTCRAHKRYRRSKSSTARDINFDGELVKKDDPRDRLTVSFGTGEVAGVFVEELVCLKLTGLLPDDADGCVPLRMIAATEMSEDPFKTFDFDGVLGLGLPGLSQAPEFNFLHVARSLLEEHGSRMPHVFSVFLANHERERSEVTLGGYAMEKLEGRLSWVPVANPQLGHWMVRIKSVKVDGKVVNYCRHDCRAVVDSGTSLLAVPTEAFPEVYGLLRHEADPVAQCRGKGPKLRIELEGFALVLDPKDYAKSQSSPPERKKKALPSLPPDFGRNESEGPLPQVCKPALMTMDLPAPVGPKLFVLGEPILRKYYTVYDTSKTRPRIGFAQARHRRWVDGEGT